MITLYTIDCPKCKVLEKKLDNAKIPYEVCKDIETMENMGFTQCPQLQVENDIYDFNKALEWIKENTVC